MGMGQGIVRFICTMAGNYYGQDECRGKKKFKGFPMFFTFGNFKTAFLGDMKQWWSRH
jgi:hypothetical protein